MDSPPKMSWRILCPSCEDTPVRITVVELFTQHVEDPGSDLHVLTATRDGEQTIRPENEILNPSRGGIGVRIWLRCAACGAKFSMIVAEDWEDQDQSELWPAGSLLTEIEGGIYKLGWRNEETSPAERLPSTVGRTPRTACYRHRRRRV